MTDEQLYKLILAQFFFAERAKHNSFIADEACFDVARERTEKFLALAHKGASKFPARAAKAAKEAK